MKEGFFQGLIKLMRNLSELYGIDLTGKNGLNSDEFLRLSEEFSHTNENLRKLFSSIKKELGNDFEYIFKKYQKIVVLMNSGDAFFKGLTSEEMDSYEDLMRANYGWRFGKVEHVWKEFKVGNIGFSELMNEGFGILEEKFMPLAVPLIDKAEFII